MVLITGFWELEARVRNSVGGGGPQWDAQRGEGPEKHSWLPGVGNACRKRGNKGSLKVVEALVGLGWVSWIGLG